MTNDNIRILGIYRGEGWVASILYFANGQHRTVDLEYDEAAEFIEAIEANPDARYEYARAIARANEKEINA